MHKENWDDLRYVLAVAQAGSVSRAARTLGVNHATVLRRIAAFEQRSGADVFERTALGYHIPPERQRVIDAMREVQTAIDGVSRLMQGAEAQMSGVIRLTSTDTFCQTILPEIVAELMASAPDLQINLHCTNAHLDLARLHADISVRPAGTLSDDLVGQQAGVLAFGAYAPQAWQGRTWLALEGALARSVAATWMLAHVPPEQIISGADSFLVLREMVAAGLGQAMLPHCLGRTDARLVARPDAAPPLSVPIWVASHAELVDAPRLRLVRSHLAKALLRVSDRLGFAADG